MDNIIDKLKEDFPNLESEKKEYFEYVEDGKGGFMQSDVPYYLYYLTQNNGDDSSVTFCIKKEDEAESLKSFLSQEPVIYKDYVGIEVNNSIEVMLAPISRFGRRLRVKDRPITVNVMYKGEEYHIEISEISEDSPIYYFIETVREVRRRANITAKINRSVQSKLDISEQEVKELLFSVLFDIEYSYEVSLDTVKYDNIGYRRAVRRIVPDLPEEPIRLVFKKYTPELIEYLHTAEKVDYLPFKYICYFHIVEYFMDKTAYMVAAKKVKELLLKPDFHIQTNKYITDAINIFKRENDKYQTDAVKLNRVFREFVEKEEVVQYLSEIKLKEHFEVDISLESEKNYKLPKIRFESDNEFFSSLVKRIYSLRCSIVHSNPDFDENKAIPFTPSEKNLYELRKEIELIKYISKNIVAKSIE